MFGAAAVRKKRKEKQNNENKEKTRGPYIKPFGPRFDPNSLPYFKYKVYMLISDIPTISFKLINKTHA